jgi:hypothetical protein
VPLGAFLGLHVEVLEDALEHGERADDLDLDSGQRRGRSVEAPEQRDESDDRADRQP